MCLHYLRRNSQIANPVGQNSWCVQGDMYAVQTFHHCDAAQKTSLIQKRQICYFSRARTNSAYCRKLALSNLPIKSKISNKLAAHKKFLPPCCYCLLSQASLKFSAGELGSDLLCCWEVCYNGRSCQVPSGSHGRNYFDQTKCKLFQFPSPAPSARKGRRCGTGELQRCSQ